VRDLVERLRAEANDARTGAAEDDSA